MPLNAFSRMIALLSPKNSAQPLADLIKLAQNRGVG